MNKNSKISSLSFVFPAYNDAPSLSILLRKVEQIAPEITSDYEIIIVNDGSKDNTAELLSDLKKKYRRLNVVTHANNIGYGAALMDGFKEAKNEYIFYTDGDGQYDVLEIVKLIDNLDEYTDVISGFKIQRFDSWYRVLLGKLYNRLAKFLFQLQVKDVDCDFRLFRRKLISDIYIPVTSGAFDVALTKVFQERNARIKNIPIHHYPRQYGESQFFTLKNIAKSVIDVFLLRFRYRKMLIETNNTSSQK